MSRGFVATRGSRRGPKSRLGLTRVERRLLARYLVGRMCGRFVTGSDELTWSEYCRLLRLPGSTPVPPTREVFPGQALEAVTVGTNGERALEQLFWGYPMGADGSDERGRLRFNSRAESVRKCHGADLAARRCVVPVAGFFFWVGEGREKLHHPHHRPLGAVGWAPRAHACDPVPGAVRSVAQSHTRRATRRAGAPTLREGRGGVGIARAEGARPPPVATTRRAQ